jgi:hypothetical protein
MDWVGAKILIGPKSKSPQDSGVHLCIIQLCGEGTIETTWPRIHPHSLLSLAEWSNTVADKGLQQVHARQPSSLQLLDDIT